VSAEPKIFSEMERRDAHRRRNRDRTIDLVIVAARGDQARDGVLKGGIFDFSCTLCLTGEISHP
jgi:hypothetical protein